MKANLQLKKFISHGSRRSGFTLIELLTVIAIIGLLGAILIPVVGGIRERAEASKSAGNLRQIGHGLGIVMLEGAPGLPPGYFPNFGGIDETSARYNWPMLVGYHLDLLDKVDNEYTWLMEPSETIFQNPLNETKLSGVRTEIPATASYGYNAQYLAGNNWANAAHGLGRYKETSGGELVQANLGQVQIQYPSRMVVFAESGQDGEAQHRIGRDTPPGNEYNNGAHYYFVDGHVEFMEYDHVMENFDRYFTPKSADLK